MKHARCWIGSLVLLCGSATHAAPDETPGSSWLAEAQRELVQREYFASSNEGGLQAPNRAQGFRTYFDGHGIQLVARSAGNESLAALALAGVGRERSGRVQHFRALGLAKVAPDAGLVALRWPGISAHYDNRFDGLHQAITLQRRASGSGKLFVALDLTAAEWQVRDDVAILHSGHSTLRLGAFAAHDARGYSLPVMITAEAGRLRLTLDDQHADYPITLKTTLKTLLNSSADALLDPNQASARLGVSVAGAGDVNGDGFGDVIVGAHFYDNGQTDEGVAFVYFGGTGAFNTTADALLELNQPSALLGYSVAGAGDVNGDGFSDVIVSAIVGDNSQSDEGIALVYYGGAGAFSTSYDGLLESNQVGAQLGSSVAGAGDVNGDGFADVIVGAYLYNNVEADEGAAFIYFGGAGTVNATPDALLEANQPSANFGYSVSGVGDVNGDGFADVIVGAFGYDNGQTNEGAAFVYFGGAGAFNLDTDALLQSDQAGAQLGSSVAGAGDVNGDGFADVIAGANVFDNGELDEGGAFVYFGGVGAFNVAADGQLESNQASAEFGNSVATAGDVNGDGFADVIVGASGYDSGESNEGAAFVYFGGTGAFDPSADAQLESNQIGARMGLSVAGAGDVNGSGFADVIVGADQYDNGELNEGAAFVYFGGAGGFKPGADALLDSNQVEAYFGFNVAGAGDVNGDGFSDVIVGAEGYDNGETDEGAAFVYFGSAGAFNLSADALLESNQTSAHLGNSVAGAGDVNGDGFADVIVGADSYDNGELSEGAAFVYFGGPGSFNASADARLESNQAGAQLGRSVAGAGDVNGDGFADVIVGAWRYANGQINEGAAFVYFGGAGTFNPSADAQLEPNQADALMGIRVAGAGDVNGDGFSDVIVGAFRYDNGHTDEGAAFLYFGRAGAFDVTADASIEANQTNAQLGLDVAGAGDVNGDGFADVIVGAALYDNGETDEGGAFLFFGGSGAFNLVVDAVLEANQADAEFGYSVAGAGDVNGDGFADVIVGADNYDDDQVDEGAAFVYYGGAGAFNPTSDVLLKSNQADAYFGIDVAGAGDVNGDGFADVIAGAYYHDNAELQEGAAFVYFGTANGRLVLASQYRGDGSTPVQPWGLSQQADGFMVALEATSPRGRERARLQLEACPPGTAFGSLSCTTRTATTWTDLGSNPLGTTLVLPATGLTLDRVYHWRARAQYAAFSVTALGITSPPNPVAGPWRRLQANADVADIRTSTPPPPVPLIFANGFE